MLKKSRAAVLALLIVLACQDKPPQPPAAAPDAVAKEALTALATWQARETIREKELQEALQEIRKWIYTDSAVKAFEEKLKPGGGAGELDKVEVESAAGGEVTLTAAEKGGGTRRFRFSMALEGSAWKVAGSIQVCGSCAGKGVACTSCGGKGGVAWPLEPRRVGAGKRDVRPSDLNRGDPTNTVKSLLLLRYEASRRRAVYTDFLLADYREIAGRYYTAGRVKQLSETWEKSAPSEQPAAIVLPQQEVEGRRAILYVAAPQGEGFRAVRVRLFRGKDDWRVEEEGLYCGQCPMQVKCGSCQGTGVMVIGSEDDPKKILCNGCKPDGGCKVCGGAGYRSDFSLLEPN